MHNSRKLQDKMKSIKKMRQRRTSTERESRDPNLYIWKKREYPNKITGARIQFKMEIAASQGRNVEDKINDLYYMNMSKKRRKIHGSTLVECIKKFEDKIGKGPSYVCTCCHQTWFRDNVEN